MLKCKKICAKTFRKLHLLALVNFTCMKLNITVCDLAIIKFLACHSRLVHSDFIALPVIHLMLFVDRSIMNCVRFRCSYYE